MPQYDLAVVGAGIGGLAAGALASKMNKKTIILEPGTSVGGALRSYQKDGFRFTPGPALSFGFGREGVFQQLNEALGITLVASPCAPCFQVALPGKRITVYAERTETLDELRREFPEEADRIDQFYVDLRKQALRLSKSRVAAFLADARTAGGLIDRYHFSQAFKAFLDVQAFYFFRQPAASLSIHSLITMCNSSPSLAEGGFGRITAQLLEVLLRNQGEIRYQVRLSETRMSRNTVSTPDGTVHAKAIMLNTEQAGLRPFTCIGLPEKAVPVGMLREVLVVPDYAHPAIFFTLSLSAKDDESAAPRGMRALTACFPHTGEPDSLQSRIGQIERIMPFLSEYSVFAEDHQPAGNDLSFLKSTALRTVKRIDRLPVLYRASEQGAYMVLDGTATPVQSVAAARALVSRII